jgi:acyl-CoA synthetase (AMP-forming)/AMP-acid ligase II
VVTNVSFALLDAPVIAGHGEDPVMGRTTHARLLEEVAALAGVLLHLGVMTGVPVVVDLDDDEDAVVAALAVTRIGGVVTRSSPDAPVAIVSAGSEVSGEGLVRLVRGEAVTEPDLDWNVMIRAGRTDPAATEVLSPGSAYSTERSVADQIALLSGSAPPYDPGELRGLLGV